MSDYIFPNVDFCKKRWIAYLDLLGSKKIIENKDCVFAFSHYSRAIELFNRKTDLKPEVEKHCFSDTFIIYTEDDSGKAFSAIHFHTHTFLDRLVRNGIPVRGAIACGEFYADKKNKLYFGKALVEAHNYGESIDFITYVLTPSAEIMIKSFNIENLGDHNYKKCKLPYKKIDNGLAPELLLYIVGSPGHINGNAIGHQELKNKMEEIEEPHIRQKYQNTLDFAEKHLNQRRFIPAQ